MTFLSRAPISLSRTSTRHARYASTGTPVIIGLRQEDPERVWERRTPLTPDMVAELIQNEGVRVLVQECEKRVFPIADYLHAGAETHATLEPAHLIMGIKETPLKTLITSPVPSPVTLGQQLLSRFLAGGDAFHAGSKSPPGLEARLIDYELLTDESGKRTVMFGFFAGVAGALESLSAMAHKHLQNGIASPFLYTPRPHSSPSLDDLRSQLHVIGSQIAEHGTPKSLGPYVIGITGNGKVTDGVMSILSELPVEHVKVDDLPAIARNPDTDLRKVYIVHCLPPSYISRNDGRPYERADYYANPGSYQSVFHTKVAPHLTLLINGAGWAPGFPRLLTAAQLPLATRLAAIGDISCDIGGGIEFMTRATTLSEPTFDFNGVSIMSVDILPASLPRDASDAFSKMAEKYIRGIVQGYKGEKVDPEVENAIKRASVAQGGKVRDGFEWLGEKVDVWRSQQTQGGGAEASLSGVRQPKQRVLVLGSGMVAGPAVNELAGKGDLDVVVASNVLSEAQRLVAPHDGAKAVQVDMNDSNVVSRLVSEADLVVSLLPTPFHPSVAEMCIQHKKHLVTASYISPAMKALHQRAISAGVLLLNEIGLDPGIDHCSAHAMLERLRGAGRGRDIRSFISFCGGLPAPEASNVPLGYKFSWSPRGVLRASTEGAHFLLGGQRHTIPGERLLKDYFPSVPVSDSEGLKFEGLANRDSMPYIDTYSLPKPEEGLQTMLRGTLRYPGFARLMQAFKDLGFLEATKPIEIDAWSSFTSQAVATRAGAPVPSDTQSVRSAMLEHLAADDFPSVWDALTTLGLVPGNAVAGAPPPPRAALPPADLLAAHLAYALRYAPGERDLVVLAHELVAQTAGGACAEVHTSRLVVYGDERASAMARTVGLPVALAAREVLKGRVDARGVCGPTARAADAVWKGVLKGLERDGIGMQEEVKMVPIGVSGILIEGLGKTAGL